MTTSDYMPTAFNHNQWILYLPSPSVEEIISRLPNDFAFELRHKCKNGLLGRIWHRNRYRTLSDVFKLRSSPVLDCICCKNCDTMPTDEEMSVLTATWMLWTRQ